MKGVYKMAEVVNEIRQRYQNKDDITEAVHGLDIFTKNFCMNVTETEKKNDLVFRCEDCQFHTENGGCLIKTFVHAHEHNYPMKDFGSMGQL